MTTPLRLGFLVSGLLHAAVVAAFALAQDVEIPAVDEPRPLTLQLAIFKPVQAAVPQPAENEPLPEPVVEQPVPEPSVPEEIAPGPEESPPVAEQPKPKPPLTKPRTVTRSKKESRQAARKAGRPRSVKAAQRERKTPRPSPPSSATVKLAAATRPQAVTPAVDLEQKQHYLAALAAKIHRRKYYPTGSRRRGEEGRVVVRFVILKNGVLTDLHIEETSGSRRLDAAALKTLRRVSPFRPIPDILDRDHWTITVPIAFSLRH